MYPEEIVAPMRKEVADIGFEELKTAEAVNRVLSAKKGTSLVFVNSICGCAAGMARPGLAKALENSDHKPDHLYTVFAGNDVEATKEARKYFLGYPPSSPAMALLKDGKLAAIVQRHDIEGHSASQVAEKLMEIFQTYCN